MSTPMTCGAKTGGGASGGGGSGDAGGGADARSDGDALGHAHVLEPLLHAVDVDAVLRSECLAACHWTMPSTS